MHHPLLKLLCCSCLAATSTLAGCASWSGKSNESYIISIGMTMGKVSKIIKSCGGSRHTGYADWLDFDQKTNQTTGGGYSAFFQLPDNTCVVLAVRVWPTGRYPTLESAKRFDSGPHPLFAPADAETDDSTLPIHSITIGPQGKPYPGKIQWREDAKLGKHRHPLSVDLGRYCDLRNKKP